MILAAFLAFLAASTGHAAIAVTHIVRQAATPVSTAEYVYSDALAPPKTGWVEGKVPLLSLYAAPSGTPPKVMWVRFRFDVGQLGIADEKSSKIAWTAAYMSERFRFFLNGREIYRNYSHPAESPMSTFKPQLVVLPTNAFLPGQNSIAIRLESDKIYTLGVSRMEIGPETKVRRIYDWRYVTQFQGILVSNSMLGVLTLFAILLWLRRRQDVTLGWLAMLGSLWFVRNLRYYYEKPPIPIDLYWHIQINLIFAMMAVFYCFAARFLDIPNRQFWTTVSLGIGTVAIISQLILTSLGISDVVSHLLVIPLSIAILFVFGRAVIIKPSLENIAMFVASTIGITSAIHDFGMGIKVWTGAHFALLPYAGVLIFLVFAFALGRRLIDALGTVENLNAILEDRVAAATSELEQTQRQIRELEIAVALEQERERIMREMHDSVGSNLISALAIAEHSNAESSTVATLKRSLTDLRIAVDSLEQVDGDIIPLLASFRHRMEPELRSAGWRIEWQVEDVPSLPWLDSSNALHLLRILQEVLSNALSHSGGNTLTFGSQPQLRDAMPGILISVSDNGSNNAPFNQEDSRPVRGKGTANMFARAKALGATLSIGLNETGGTKVLLWLPLHR
jgi:signal transduction histidine kinase